jgi:hypothetical protein
LFLFVNSGFLGGFLGLFGGFLFAGAVGDIYECEDDICLRHPFLLFRPQEYRPALFEKRAGRMNCGYETITQHINLYWLGAEIPIFTLGEQAFKLDAIVNLCAG